MMLELCVVFVIQGRCSGFLRRLFPDACPAGIIVIRVWHLYAHNQIGRFTVLFCYVATIIVTVVIVGTEWHRMEPHYVPTSGCIPPGIYSYVPIFILNLVLHSILYIATAIPALRIRHRTDYSVIMTRILWECVVSPCL